MTNHASFASLASLVLLACNRAPSTPLGEAANGSECEVGSDLVVCGYTVSMTVSDTGFRLGPVDSGSDGASLVVGADCYVVLTMTNTGTRSHDLVVGCPSSGLPTGCAQRSCFPNPDDAGAGLALGAWTVGPVTLVPPVQPGSSTTATFDTPFIMGTYPFISDEPGDNTQFVDGGVTGPLAGEFVLR